MSLSSGSKKILVFDFEINVLSDSVEKKEKNSPKMVKFFESFYVLAWILAVVNGYYFNFDKVPDRILKEGESCQIKTGGPGVCTLLTSCEVYFEALKTESIEYSSIVRCSFKGQDEVICCPLKTTEELLPGTFKGAEVVTEGPLEELTQLVAAKTLKAGSICQTKTAEPGVCKLLSACGVYLEGLQKETIEYSSSIFICSFMGEDEVVCCPNNDLPTNHHVLGPIPTKPPRMPRPPFPGTIPMPSENNTEIGSPNKILKSGAICQTKTGEPGVCKLLSACGVYLEALQKETIKYSSIIICSFMGQDEVICCPNNDVPTNHHVLGHIPTEMPPPTFTGTTPSENNTEIGRPSLVLYLLYETQIIGYVYNFIGCL
ncbi:uncharacterized protein LOC129907072 [Episyrphus balteatus]|uniref:uncharacterized protein LOC129907072 n=1 Tax=Episyrphus balteatus TaxID=286459 RepID=UPI002485CA1B|nr:uncharacterized protein LOC129907072 [Episyrphus balteatus]